MYLDDRWLYDLTDDLPPVQELDLSAQQPRCLVEGRDLTIVAAGYSTRLALDARSELAKHGIRAEVIDLRVLNPLRTDAIMESVRKTGRLLVVDGGWRTCGIAAEVIASVAERVPVGALIKPPVRITLPDAPAPASRVLEKAYYPSAETVLSAARQLLAQ